MADDSQNAGWSIFGYLISGMVFYGGLGWLIGHWTHIAVLFPIGALVGLGVGDLRGHLQVRAVATVGRPALDRARPPRYAHLTAGVRPTRAPGSEELPCDAESHVIGA